MKSIVLLCLAIYSLQESSAQSVKYQTDQHIVNQQERMVFKQWDRKKFTPTRGFLSLNPNYWLTWAWHPNYPKTDLRPLSAAGPQTQRLLLVAAMKNASEDYKKHTDTLRNLALSEMAGYAGVISITDPLWQMYYRNEFRDLIDPQNPLQGSSSEVQNYLSQIGVLDWYIDERNLLAQRLNSARTTNMDRGARIMTYHNVLYEYRQLIATWEAKKQRAELYLNLSKVNAQIKEPGRAIVAPPSRTDRQIADHILSKTKL